MVGRKMVKSLIFSEVIATWQASLMQKLDGSKALMRFKEFQGWSFALFALGFLSWFCLISSLMVIHDTISTLCRMSNLLVMCFFSNCLCLYLFNCHEPYLMWGRVSSNFFSNFWIFLTERENLCSYESVRVLVARNWYHFSLIYHCKIPIANISLLHLLIYIIL